jgi:hypothetical protein
MVNFRGGVPRVAQELLGAGGVIREIVLVA